MQLRLNKLDAFSVWFDNKPFIFLSSDKDTNVRIRFAGAFLLPKETLETKDDSKIISLKVVL